MIACELCGHPLTPPRGHDPTAVFLCGHCAASKVLREAFLEGRARLREGDAP